MNKWYSLNLGDEVKAHAPTSKIQEAFWPMHIVSNSPKDMGVYSRYDLETNIVTVYFTPSAKPLAEMFGAKECEQPRRERLIFLVGPASCLDLWPVGERR